MNSHAAELRTYEYTLTVLAGFFVALFTGVSFWGSVLAGVGGALACAIVRGLHRKLMPTSHESETSPPVESS
jgi:hypothetical protein